MTAKIDAITFEAGIVSELVEPRHTMLNHGRGCRQLRNFITYPQGPATADPGTAFIAGHANPGRIVRVTYSETQSYIAHFTDHEIRFYDHAGPVGEVIDSPYAYEELWDLQFTSQPGVLYVWHTAHPPHRLIFGQTWLIEPVPFEGGPFVSREPNDITLGFEDDDSHSYFHITADQVDVNEMPMAADAYLSKDFGVGHFEDFEIRFRFYAGWMSQNFYVANNLVSLANAVGTQHERLLAEEKYVSARYSYSWSYGANKVFLALSCWFSTSSVYMIEIQQYKWHYVILTCDFDGGANGQGRYTLRTSQDDYYDQAGATSKQSRTYDVPSGGQTAYRYLHSPQANGNPWGSSVPVRTTYSVADLKVDSVGQDFTTFDANDGGGAVLLTANQPVFADGHIGSLWQLGARRAARLIQSGLGGDASTGYVRVGRGAGYLIHTTGTFNATITIERSYDDGATWEEVARQEKENFDQYAAVELSDNARYRVTMSDYVSGTCTVSISVEAHMAYGIVEILDVVSETEAQAVVRVPLPSTAATKYWSEGAWSGVRGYPRAGGLFDNRLVAMATPSDPTTIWMSRTNQHTNMRAGADAADALIFTLTTGTGDPFLWLHADRVRSFVGTASAILEVAAANPQASVAPSNPLAIVRRVELGTCAIQPVLAQSSLIFVGPDRKRVMHTMYDWQQDRVISPDLAFDCPGLTEAAIKEIVYQPTPFPIVWFLLHSGQMVGMTYEERYDRLITGWHLHDGPIDSIAVLPGPRGHHLWRLGQRHVDGDLAYQVERTDALDIQMLDHAHRLSGYVEVAGGWPIWAIQRYLTVDGLYRVLVALTEEVEGLEDGDFVTFSNVAGAEWMNTTWRVRDVQSQSINPPSGMQDATTFVLANPDGTRYDAKGLQFDYALLPPTLLGATVGTSLALIVGLDHLEGEVVYAIADGVWSGPYTVAGGQIELAAEAGKIFVGRMPEPSVLEPLRLVLPTRSGSTRAHQLNVPGVWVSLYRSLAAKVGRDLDHLETLPISKLTTSDFFVRIETGFDSDPHVLIVNDNATPLTVRCLMLDTSIHGVRSLPG